MSKIKLAQISQLENRIISGQCTENILLEFDKENQTYLKVRITVEINLNKESYAQHTSLSVWNNVSFNISPDIISSDDFQTLKDLVQASMGHERILFVNSNLEYLEKHIPFYEDAELDKLLRTLIMTHYN